MRFASPFLRSLAAAGALLASLWAIAPAAHAQGTATLNGVTATNTCTFTSATMAPNGNISITCQTGGATSANITLGAASGVLTTPAANSVTIAANCSGNCAGVAVTLALNPPVSGVSITSGVTYSFTTAGNSTPFTISGSGNLTPGSVTAELTVNSAGTGVTPTPAINGTVTASIPISAGNATFSLGTPSGSLIGSGGSIATIVANCAGSACAGAQVTLASLTAGVGVAVPSYTFTGSGASTPFTFGNVGPLAGSTGSLGLTVNSVSAGVTSTPAVGAVNAITQTFSIQAALPNTNAAGTASFPPSASVVENTGVVTVNITRTGMGANSPDWYQTVNCSVSPGYSPAPAVLNTVNTSTALPSTVVYWLGTAPTATLTINPTTAGASGGTVTCSFAGSPQVFGATAAGSNPTLDVNHSAYTLTVTKVGGGGGGGPPPGCTTTADQTFDLVSYGVSPPSAGTATGNRAVLFGMSGSQTAAIRFSPLGGQSGGGGATISMPTVYGPAPIGSQIQSFVSECPGDFVNAPADARFIKTNATVCGFWDNSQVQFLQFGTTIITPQWACYLDPSKTYYLNFKYRTQSGGSSCTGTCSVYVDVNRN